MTARGSVHGRPAPIPGDGAGGRSVRARPTGHRSSPMPSSTTAILPMFPVDAARLSGQLFSEVRAAERPCAKHQQ
jgi:hypothetical protein